MKHDDGMDDYRREAKLLYKKLLSGNPDARKRVAAIMIDQKSFTLMNVQHVIAREKGFNNWNAMREETLGRTK